MPGGPDFVTLSAGRAATGFVVGLALGVWIALYEGHLMAYRPARWLLTLLDLAFWAVALVLVAVGLYFTDWLSLRLYAAFVIALGCLAALYLAGFFFRFVSYALTRGMLTVFWLFLRPLRWFTRTLGRHQGRRSRPTGGAGGDPRTGNKSASTRRGRTARPWWVPGG